MNDLGVKLDQLADYVPLASSLTNAVDLYQKCIYSFYGRELATNENRYFYHIKDKPVWRCITLLVPVVGNGVVAMYDLLQTKKAPEKIIEEVNPLEDLPRGKETKAETEVLTPPQPPVTHTFFVPLDSLFSFLETEFDETKKNVRLAANSFSIVADKSIVNQETGVIQDAAGSAIGTGKPPHGGGLSGAIYKKFKGQLSPIPLIEQGQSILNSQTSRILHTYSPKLEKTDDLKTAISKISDAYYNAIQTFIRGYSQHNQDTLNLCAISASIYGGKFASKGPWRNHIDPSITELALCLALVKCQKNHPDLLKDKEIKLFYLGHSKNRAFISTVHSVKKALAVG